VPLEGNNAATKTIDATEANNNGAFNKLFVDNFEGIHWSRLLKYINPLVTKKNKKSWIYCYGFCIILIKESNHTFFFCRHCHEGKIIDAGGGGLNETTLSTSTSARHLEQEKRGHGYQALNGPEKVVRLLPRCLRQVIKDEKISIPQIVADELGCFKAHGFRLAAVTRLVENNYLLREFETPAFCQSIASSNPEAEASSRSHYSSVLRFLIRLYDRMRPQAVYTVSQSQSKIYISFDGWTTKCGRRSFMGVIAHEIDINGDIVDIPTALPQLSGTHTAE